MLHHRLAFRLTVVVGFACARCAHAQMEVLAPPYVEPQDTIAALTTPDLYAWKLFVALNWPADVAKRAADPSQHFGDNLTTVWESWKLTSGKNDEVFLPGGKDPGPWGKARSFDVRRLRDYEDLPLQQSTKRRDGALMPFFDPATSAIGKNENHMNKEAFDFIRSNELYNVEGQEKLLQKAVAIFDAARNDPNGPRSVDFSEYRLTFPSGAKEIKAQWRPIGPDDKDRYRWVEFKNDKGEPVLYGLTALHITTKDLPNWLWATFEHVDNPKRSNAEPWILPTVDRSAGPKGYPERIGIEGTRWQNYRLRGTQIEFTNSLGQTTLLANSQIEKGFQTSSSCITCHARATIGPKTGSQPNRLSIFQSQFGDVSIGSTGIPDQGMYLSKTSDDSVTGKVLYYQLDFVWSLFRASRKTDLQALAAMNISFSNDIRPLFRPKDIQAMKNHFDLSKYDDVKNNADDIYYEVNSGRMPCDGPWPSSKVELFYNWMQTGMKP